MKDYPTRKCGKCGGVMKVISADRKYVWELSFLPIPFSKELHYQCELCNTEVELGHFLTLVFSWFLAGITIVLIVSEPENIFYWVLFAILFPTAIYKAYQRWRYRKV